MEKIKTELLLSGYSLEAKSSDTKTVFSSLFKFKGLLFEAGLSPLKSQNFSVKLEIDTNPPAGAVLHTCLVQKFFPVTLVTFELPSLLAGKIHAILTRKYTKGRDYFDLYWYLANHKNLEPNITLLRNALIQTHYTGKMPDTHHWREPLAQALHTANWDDIRNDVRNFLENSQDINAITQEGLLKLLAP